MWLEYLTLGWNVIGTFVVLGAGTRANSVALVGFGIDSLIEIFAAVIVIWQLKGIGQQREQRALRLIGIAFFVLAAYVSAQSLRTLLTEARPDTSLLHDVLAECDHMTSLVEDLLTLSRSDAKPVPQVHAPVALAPLLADVQRHFGARAAERQVTLQVEVATGSVLVDPVHLRQVLVILCDNALRHTPTGGTITLRSSVLRHIVTMSVNDTGSGIAPEHLPHVFERFYRASSARLEATSGAGLGLSIAQSIMRAYHGRIVITSQVGHGTQVILTLPAAAVQQRDVSH